MLSMGEMWPWKLRLPKIEFVVVHPAGIKLQTMDLFWRLQTSGNELIQMKDNIFVLCISNLKSPP